VNAEKRAKITVERTYRATIGEVWDLWTTTAGFESWWGPQGFRVEVHALDARPGGELRYDMIADTDEMKAAMRQMGQPTSHPTHSTFSVLEHHRRLELTNVIDFLPGVTTYESHIGVDFIVAGDTVRMVVTMDELHNAQFTQMQLAGFTSQLTKLDGRFV
jgi:uncharacterized protein YndB with AHSA1/START domain